MALEQKLNCCWEIYVEVTLDTVACLNRLNIVLSFSLENTKLLSVEEKSSKKKSSKKLMNGSIKGKPNHQEQGQNILKKTLLCTMGTFFKPTEMDINPKNYIQ